MNDAEVAIAAAETGASVVWNRFGTKLERLDKGMGDFATSADLEAEDAMIALLRGERPQDCILGEERGRSTVGSELRTWFIDPLCGTLNYAARMRVASVNVALRTDGKFTAAAVADPFNAEIFWTDSQSSFLRISGFDAPLVPSGGSSLVDLNLNPPLPNGSVARLAADSEFAASFRPRVLSTSLALAWVATGQRAAFITEGDVRDSVHYAAALALCQASGCVLTDLCGNEWGSGETGLLAAADLETHSRLLYLLRKHTA